jgi:drug/metabolite transporter (DMT)-like permease
MRSGQASDRLTLAAFLGIVVIGGTNFVAVKFSIFELPPFWGAALRFLTASVLFFLVVAVRRISLPRGRALLGDIIYGILGFGASYAFAYFALVNLKAGFVSVILALVPLGTLFLASVQGQEHLKLRGLVGGSIALAGTALVFNEQLTLAIPIASLVALLGAIFAISEASIVIKHFPRSDPYATNAVAMTTGSLILVALSAFTHESWSLPNRQATWIAYTYLVLLGSVLLFMLYLYVLSRWTASAANYGFVLTPLVTVVVASILAGERVSYTFVGGSALVLIGVCVGALARTR